MPQPRRNAGAVLIAHWAWKLMRDASPVLLDRSGDPAFAQRIQQTIEVSDRPLTAQAYRDKLRHLPGLSHVTVEIRLCDHSASRPIGP